MTNNYTSDDIQVLSDIEHVRARTQIYLGNTNPATYDIPLLSTTSGFGVVALEFVPAVLRAIYEITDNSVDEFEQNGNRASTLSIAYSPSTGRVTVRDNGRGVPIGKHKAGGYTPEVVFGSLRSGRNFVADKKKGVRGQNGVGSACVAFTSSVFEITINRDSKQYFQRFLDGSNVRDKPVITDAPGVATGTQISFALDSTVYKSTKLPEQLITNIANEIAFNNPKVTVEYTNTDTEQSQTFKYMNGLSDIVRRMSNSFFKFTDKDGIEFFVIFDAHNGIDERIFTWVNSVVLFDGGICNTQFINSFCDIVETHLEKQAKRSRCTVTKNDIRQNLLILGTLKVSDPEFDSQTKSRLTGPNLKQPIHKMIEDQFAAFAKQNAAWLDLVVERAAQRHHSRADKSAVNDLIRKRPAKIPGLLNATGADRSKCMVLITEGESASSQIEEVRDPKTTATFAMSGKFNNVYDSTVAQVLTMGKLKDLLLSIGLVPGRKADRSTLQFGHRIIIATDADADGDDIFTLLVNLFYKFWPELLDPNKPPILYRLISPNVVASKGKVRKHFVRLADFEAQASKYSGWNVEYMKGLGSLHKPDWEQMLSNIEPLLIPIVDDGSISEVLELLFSSNAEPRKLWLSGESV